MKFQLILLFAALFCNCHAFLFFNPITSLRNYSARKVNETRNRINDATEYGKNLKRTAVNNLNSIKQYSGKTLNDAKNVRSFGDASNLGRTLVNDGIQTTGYYVKSALFRKTIDEEMRKRIIMRDCISLVISQLNAFDLTNFIQVSKNLTSLGEEKIAKMQIVPNDQVPDAETHYFADLNIAAAQNAVNSEETRQYTPKSFNVNQSNKYFETLMYLGNTIPSCYHYNYNINLLQNKK